MPGKTKLLRFLFGLVAVSVTLVVCFSVLLARVPTWGATAAEAARPLPGDEYADNPVINWTNAVTIDAPVEQVWPWLAQMGELRGGFYSYTFIENLVTQSDNYHNADRILPEFQHPQPGTNIIVGLMDLAEVEPGKYLLGKNTSDGMGWTWVWLIEPAADGQTRLINRIYISLPEGAGDNPILSFFMGVGAFVMEHNMMDGIRLRAEGGIEPASIEMVEIVLWLAALAAGLVTAGMFVFRKEGAALNLGLGLACVVWLAVLTLVQPAIWVRILVDLALAGGVALLALRHNPAAAEDRLALQGVK